MPIPIVTGIAAAGAAILVESVVHPWRVSQGVQFLWDDTAKSYNAWYDSPFLIPSAEQLLDVDSKMWGNTEDTVNWGLRKHGITMRLPILDAENRTIQGRNMASRRWLWRLVQEMQRSVPGPGVWAAMNTRGFTMPDLVRPLIKRAGGSADLWLAAQEFALHRPDPALLWESYVRGVFPDTVPFKSTFLRAGGHFEDYDLVASAYRQMPSVGEAMEGYRRGVVDFDLWSAVLKYHRVDDPKLLPLWQELRKGIPGISDLLRMGSRLLFTPELAGRYGLYDGFQEASRPYFARLGLDYPLGFQIPVDGVQREATLPDLYWGATREILPLGIAYAAYQRLRPSQVAKYRDEVPELRDFSIDDLRLHMRVAGYPPPMQDYLIALSHPPLGRRDIPQVMQYLGRDADWAYGQYLNLGLRSEDARAVADTAYQRVHAHDTAWITSIRDGSRKNTIKEIEGLYDEGIIDRGQALRQLSVAGLPEELSVQLLDLSDARRARGLLRAAVTATGRDYLSGALSAAEALSALGQYGIKQQRAGELMQIWTIRRSRHRRQADTSRIIRWVGEGRISVAEAEQRLANLQWTNPDILLLLGEGEAKLAALRARAEATQERAAASRAKELDRLSRETDAEARRQRAEANRVAPRSALIKWLTDGVITRDEFYSLMRDRGYPEEDIDRYYTDATSPKPPRPKVVPADRARPRPAGSTHPAVTILKRWAKESILSRPEFEEGLRALGYDDADVQRFVKEQYEPGTTGGA